MLGAGSRRVAVIGHRGACGRAPENTLTAFRLALQMGVDMVECDVRLTRDGVPILLHDPELQRTTNGWGPVGDYTLEQIRRLNVSAWPWKRYPPERVALLEELLDLCRGRCGVGIDIKPEGAPGVELATIQVVQRLGMESSVVFFCFDPAILRRCKEKTPSIRRALSFKQPLADPIGLARELGAQGIVPHLSRVTPDLLAAAHGAKLFVAPWTVNRRSDMRRLSALGVDAIITNYPDTLRAVLHASVPPEPVERPRDR